MVSNLKQLLTILFLCATVTSCQQGEKPEKQEKIGSVPLSLQLQWVTQSQFAGFYVALEKGWYLEEGIDLTIYQGGPDFVPVDQVAAGGRDFGTTLLPDLTVSIGDGKPVISIAQIQQANGLRLIARKDSGIETVADLVGKKVGVWLGSWEIQFAALLASQGIEIDKVQVVSQGWSMTPFLEGQLDVASAMIYNEYLVVMESGISKDSLRVIDYAEYDINFPGDVIFTSLKMAQENPQLCKKMVRASLRGWEYAMGHPHEAVQIVLKHDKSKIQKSDHQLEMLNQITNIIHEKGAGAQAIGHFNQLKIKRMVDLLVEYEVMKQRVKLERIYTERFLTDN